MAVRLAVHLFALLRICGGVLVPDGAYSLRNLNGGKYMNAAGGRTTPGTKVIVWDNPTSPHTQWAFKQAGNDTCTVQNVNSGLYLTANGTAKGSKLILMTNASSPSALWMLVEVSGASSMMFAIKGVASGLFINVLGGSTSLGATVQLWDNPGSLHSQWALLGVGCHDARPGELCYNDTVWAKEYAIFHRPEWYPGLTNASTFADFQAHLHDCYWRRCPMPCAQTQLFGCDFVHRFWSNATCADAANGTKCYDAVSWAMKYGIKIYPQWYPELTENSTFGQFQARLYSGQASGIDGDHGCSEPCCHDARPGEMCHEDATWAMLYGINLPGWHGKVYPEALTNRSAFVEFQAYLHLCYPSRCPKPCRASALMAARNLTLSCPDRYNNYI